MIRLVKNRESSRRWRTMVAASLLGFATFVAQAAESERSTLVITGGAPAILSLALQLPAEEVVAFDGMVSYDKAGSDPYLMQYPAPNAAGFLAGLLTHALVNGSVREGERRKLRDKANEVLLPYQAILTEFKYPQLLTDASVKIATQCGKKVLTVAQSPDEGEVVVESHPVFSLTQDQSALVLNNWVKIRVANGTASYQNMLRVISGGRTLEQPVKFWSDEQGRNLKAESARLFAQSIDMALADWRDADKKEKVFKTVRYREGGSEKMERAQVLSEQCNQIVMRNLRGNLMSVPATDAVPASEACTTIPTASGIPATTTSRSTVQQAQFTGIAIRP